MSYLSNIFYPRQLDSTHLCRRKLVFLQRNVRLRKRNTNSSRLNRASNSPSSSHTICPHSSLGGDSTPCLIVDQESNTANNESGEDEEQRRINRFKKDPCEGSFEEDEVKKESER